MAGAACAKIIIDSAARTEGNLSCLSGTAGLLAAASLDATQTEANQVQIACESLDSKIQALVQAWSNRMGIHATPPFYDV
jgi:hypothetical protein